MWVCSQGIRFWHGLRRRPLGKCGQYRLELANNLRTLSLKPVLLVTVGQRVEEAAQAGMRSAGKSLDLLVELGDVGLEPCRLGELIGDYAWSHSVLCAMRTSPACPSFTWPQRSCFASALN
jgi:hypothetical protein